MSTRLQRRSGATPRRSLTSIIASIAVCVAATGCKDNAAAKACGAARDQSRRAALKDDLEKARAELRHARELCGADAEYDLRRIEELIEQSEQREQQLLVRKARESAKDKEEPLRPFVRWVGKTRDDVDTAAQKVTCAERGSPDFGYCEGQPATGSSDVVPMTVRFWRADPSAFRFHIQLSMPVTCGDIGNHRVVRTWKRGSTALTLCELTEYPIQGLTALVENEAGGAQVFIVSPEYLTQDTEFHDLVQYP